MIPKAFVLPAIIYAIGVFYFVVWVLDGYYKRVLKRAIDEIGKQYARKFDAPESESNQ
jgi:hypothetical protein